MALPSSSTSKRACADAITCLVDGCAADLIDCRKYYQRHKVCEIHSKSPHVSINGQNLRFCQQCSRFHSLEEFDEGKRSCRKRLDGHNRRRRKPRPPPDHGTNMLQSTGEPHPTTALTSPLWGGVAEALPRSNHAPSLLSLSVKPPQESVSTPSHVIAASLLDQRPSYGGLENDCDVVWEDMADIDIDPYYPASFDPQTLPLYWQS